MVLVARLLQLARGGGANGATRDDRSVMAVLDAAAERTGKPREPGVAVKLREQGVDWAWQLEQLSEDDWARLGATLGLKTAAKAELVDPTVVVSARKAATSLESARDDEMIRQFLLLPGPDGKEAKPLCQLEALMFGLLVVPIADRQVLMLALCEVMALVAGLFLPMSFEFRRQVLAEPSAAKGWDVPPTLLDGMDAIVLNVFIVNAAVAYWAVGLALCIAAGGWHADDRFCRGAMGGLALLWVTFSFCVFMPTLTLCFWRMFTDSASPYPILGAFVLINLVFTGLNVVAGKFIAEQMALESYHMPRRWKTYARLSLPWIKHMWTDEVLKPKAEMRAAKLRAQRGFTARFVI